MEIKCRQLVENEALTKLSAKAAQQRWWALSLDAWTSAGQIHELHAKCKIAEQ